MNKKTVLLSITTVLVALTGYSEQERVIHLQNHVRFGYDDNVYQNNSKNGSSELMDILNISGKLRFSGRSDAVFSYQPEVRYRFDADPKTVTYQDLYGRLNHALSPIVFLDISDRLRYRQRDAQSGNVSMKNQNYLENDAMGAVSITLNSLSSLKLGGGYEFRNWDDKNYGKTLGNNYSQYKADASYFRELSPNVMKGMIGVNYLLNDYDGSRGSFDSVTVLGGADRNFSPNTTGFGRVGASISSVDYVNGTQKTTTPYLETGFDYNPSDRTSINGSADYSIYRSENSLYNSQNRLKLGVGVSHDLTGKISVASSLSYIYSRYSGDVAYSAGHVGIDANDTFIQWNLRASYQINRNNFVEAGYEYTDRLIDTFGLVEYDRNRVDIGWRLRL